MGDDQAEEAWRYVRAVMRWTPNAMPLADIGGCRSVVVGASEKSNCKCPAERFFRVRDERHTSVTAGGLSLHHPNNDDLPK